MVRNKIHVRRNENIKLVVDYEIEVGIHINSEGQPEVKWERMFNKNNIKIDRGGFPEVELPGWLKHVH